MSEATEITERNRVNVRVGCFDWAHPSHVSGSIAFQFAPDAPFEKRHASYGVDESVAISLAGQTDALEVAEALKGCRLSGWSGEPSIGQVTDYLNSVADRDYYLECLARLPKIEAEIERLEKERDLKQSAKCRYEAEHVAEKLQAVIR